MHVWHVSICSTFPMATTSGVLVQGKIAEYLNRLAQLGVAGVRVDAAKHLNSWDMGSILQVSCNHIQSITMNVSRNASCGMTIYPS